jgi:hypothetical protein
MLKPFYPALLKGRFETEQAAIQETGLDMRQLSGKPRQLVGGGQLYIINNYNAFIIQLLGEKDYELWFTGVDLSCDTREDALDDIEQYEAIEELGRWQVFELKNPGESL